MNFTVQATWEELCTAFKLESGYNIGHRAETLAEQTAIFKAACVKTLQKAMIKCKGKKTTYQKAFAPKPSLNSTRCINGAPCPGIQRRPMWDQCTVDHVARITYEAHESRCNQAAEATDDYVDGYVISYANTIRPAWKPTPLTEVRGMLHKRQQQIQQQRQQFHKVVQRRHQLCIHLSKRRSLR